MKVNGIDYTQRTRDLTTVGIDAWGTDDTVFGVKYVFCNQHVAAHVADGHCTVSNIEKFPLPAASTREEAHAEYLALGFLGLWDSRPCNHCGTPVTRGSISAFSADEFRDESGSLGCDPTNPRSRRHDGSGHRATLLPDCA